MSGFDEDDVVVTDGTGVDRDARNSFDRRVRSGRALSMFDRTRGMMYAAMAGLVHAGLGMGEAAAILANEYRTEQMDDAAESVSMFFGEVVRAIEGRDEGVEPAAVVREAALRAFGTRFVGPEEMALLKALTVSKTPERILRACADIITQYETERLVGSTANFRRLAS